MSARIPAPPGWRCTCPPLRDPDPSPDARPAQVAPPVAFPPAADLARLRIRGAAGAALRRNGRRASLGDPPGKSACKPPVAAGAARALAGPAAWRRDRSQCVGESLCDCGSASTAAQPAVSVMVPSLKAVIGGALTVQSSKPLPVIGPPTTFESWA